VKHFEMNVRRLVIKGVLVRVIFDGIVGRRAIK
jgi:hypothetical protein